MVDTIEQHEALVKALLDPKRWVEGGGDRRLIETHISSVVLAGEDAYKLNKPLNLGFLDFSTLERRRLACVNEIRLNRRLAPQIYRRAVPITGSIEAPRVGGQGAPIEWAVHMQRFDPDAILGHHPDALSHRLVVQLARRVARFHGAAPTCPEELPFGTPQAIFTPIAENFSHITPTPGCDRQMLEDILHWLQQQHLGLREIQQQRRARGYIRECHGDLHLGNIALIDGEPVIFDALEFNPALRWIDTFSDLAFLTMDLARIGRADLTHWLLDAYLQLSGDYRGLRLLRFYETYRATVRAKVAAIRIAQPHLTAAEREAENDEFVRYMRLAETYSHASARALVITHGVAGAGKSTVAGKLLDQLYAVRIRSDVERKRIAGVEPDLNAKDRANAALYGAAMTERTYARLAELAQAIVDAGAVAIVDATFLQRAHRRRFAALAATLGVPYVILDCAAPTAVLRERVRTRAGARDNVSDADIGVLEAQLKAVEQLAADERASSMAVSPDAPLDLDDLLRRLSA